MSHAQGLRARKKDRTRDTLVRTGLRMIARDGYDAVTIGSIAEAAEVSRATFFNYFSSKEELVLAPGTEPHRRLMSEAFAERSPTDSPESVLLSGVRRMLGADAWTLDPNDELVVARVRLVATVPAVRAAFLGQLADLQRTWTDQLIAEFGTRIDRIQAATLVGAVTGGITNAVFTQIADGGAPDRIPAVIERAAVTVLNP